MGLTQFYVLSHGLLPIDIAFNVESQAIKAMFSNDYISYELWLNKSILLLFLNPLSYVVGRCTPPPLCLGFLPSA